MNNSSATDARPDYYTKPCACGANPAYHLGHTQVCANANAPRFSGRDDGIRSRSPRFEPKCSPSLLWPNDAELLHDRLADRGVVDPDTGERFTVRRCDDAIQSAVETFNGRENARISDLFDLTWHLIGDDLADALGIAYDEMVEVAR